MFYLFLVVCCALCVNQKIYLVCVLLKWEKVDNSIIRQSSSNIMSWRSTGVAVVKGIRKGGKPPDPIKTWNIEKGDIVSLHTKKSQSE